MSFLPMCMRDLLVTTFSLALCLCLGCVTASPAGAQDRDSGPSTSPNFVFIFTDDMRYDTFGYVGNPHAITPNIDALAGRGVVFNNAYVTLSICSPSRATSLTGRYSSTVGITTWGSERMLDGVPTFASTLREAGYFTGVNGKWHVGNSPEELGFDWHSICHANDRWYGRNFHEQGEEIIAEGYLEAYIADRSIAFMEQAVAEDRPFVLWHCTQVPHMDHAFDWPAQPDVLAQFDPQALPLPSTWQSDHAGKPPYLRTARSYTRAQSRYGYAQEGPLRNHIHRHYASLTELDRELGRVIEAIDALGLADNTYIVFLSDNGWMLGEHGLTSKVLPYELSWRVPLIIAGPGLEPGERDQFALNADIMPTLLEWAGVDLPEGVHGESLVPMLEDATLEGREAIFYESPTPQLIPRPFFAVRNEQYKYIETRTVEDVDVVEFVELYDTHADPDETRNLALDPAYAEMVQALAQQLREMQAHYTGE